MEKIIDGFIAPISIKLLLSDLKFLELEGSDLQ